MNDSVTLEVAIYNTANQAPYFSISVEVFRRETLHTNGV